MKKRALVVSDVAAKAPVCDTLQGGPRRPTYLVSLAGLWLGAILLAGTGCSSPEDPDGTSTDSPTPTAATTAVPTPTATPTNSQEPTATPLETSTPTETPEATPTLEPPPTITTSSAEVNFGSVPTDASAQLGLVLNNAGPGSAQVSMGITAGEDVFTLNSPEEGSALEIDAGDQLEILISYSPISAVSDAGLLSIATDDPNTPLIPILLSGEGRISSTDEDGDGHPLGLDCDDNSATIYPGADELCDEIDQDCDGDVDEGLAVQRYHADDDQDGFGDFSDHVDACAPVGGYIDEPESNLFDCNDGDASVYPGALEACDGEDNDCDGAVDEDGATPFYPDEDSDGHGALEGETVTCDPEPGLVSDSSDCDDEDPAIYPGAVETCDGRDQDCDGVADEGVLEAFYADQDGDGSGDPDVISWACQRPDGFASTAGDCDDDDPNNLPGGTEQCDGRDNDCDGKADDGLETVFYADEDHDGYGSAQDATVACEQPEGYVENDDDCDDASPSVYLGAEEVCNGVDDDCDTRIDDGVLNTFFRDADGDGFGADDDTETSCDPSEGFVEAPGDCDDDNPDAYPRAQEVCGGSDLDCDDEQPLCQSCREIRAEETDEGDGVYWIDPGDGEAIPVYCDMTTAGGGWTMVYKISREVAGDAYVLWTGDPLNETDESLLTPAHSSTNYVSRIPSRFWNSNTFIINEVRLHIYVDEAIDKFIYFNGSLANNQDWFSEDRVLESSWTDLLSEPKNYFSIAGDSSLKRRFFVNRNYDGCSSDAGWLVAAKPGGGCSWELDTPGMRIIYASGQTYQNWTSATESGEVGLADTLAVLVR